MKRRDALQALRSEMSDLRTAGIWENDHLFFMDLKTLERWIQTIKQLEGDESPMNVGNNVLTF